MSEVCVKVLEKTIKNSSKSELKNTIKELFADYEKVIRIHLPGLFTDFTQPKNNKINLLSGRLYTQSTPTITTTSYK